MTAAPVTGPGRAAVLVAADLNCDPEDVEITAQRHRVEVAAPPWRHPEDADDDYADRPERISYRPPGDACTATSGWKGPSSVLSALGADTIDTLQRLAG